MDELTKKISEAQKEAQKKYDQKTKMVSIKYTPVDMDDFNELNKYVNRTTWTVNRLIKALVKDFLKNGNSRISTVTDDNRANRKRFQEYEFCPFSFIDEDKIQFLYDTFGIEFIDRIFDEFYDNCFEYEMEDLIEDKGSQFEDWIELIQDDIQSGEMIPNNTEDFYKLLSESLYENVR